MNRIKREFISYSSVSKYCESCCCFKFKNKKLSGFYSKCLKSSQQKSSIVSLVLAAVWGQVLSRRRIMPNDSFQRCLFWIARLSCNCFSMSHEINQKYPVFILKNGTHYFDLYGSCLNFFEVKCNNVNDYYTYLPYISGRITQEKQL